MENENQMQQSEIAVVTAKGFERHEVRSLFIEAAIKEHWKQIAIHVDATFVSAQQVLRALHDLNIPYRLDGQRLKKANAVGDAMGLKGLNLPVTSPPGRAYFLPAIEMSEDEAKAFVAMAPSQVAKLAVDRLTQIKAELQSEAFETKEDEYVDETHMNPNHNLAA